MALFMTPQNARPPFSNPTVGALAAVMATLTTVEAELATWSPSAAEWEHFRFYWRELAD